MTQDPRIFLVHALDCIDFIEEQLIWGILSQHLQPLRQAVAEHLEAQP